MQNIPLILNLGKNLTEYSQHTADHRTFTNLVNQHFGLDQLVGHKADCTATQADGLKYHGSYQRTKIIDTGGEPHCARIHRVYCPKCRVTWRVYPSILTPGKHYDSYVVQNRLEDVLSSDQTYRAIIRQQAQLTSSGEVKPHRLRAARTPWQWVVWLGQFSLPVVLLACGLTPPSYVVEDEKFLKQNRQKSYTVGLVDHRFDLLWWLDYVFSTDQAALQASLGQLSASLKLADATHYFKGGTSDSWAATKNAFGALDPRTKLAECVLHPMLKFEQELARYIRLQGLSKAVEQILLQAFWQLLLAPDEATWDAKLI